MYILIIAILALSLTAFLLYAFHFRYILFIKKNSIPLKKLIQINQKYSFYPDIDFDQSHTYDNENFFESISCADYLIYNLQFIKSDIEIQIKKINSNKLLYEQYINEANSLKLGKFEAENEDLKPDILCKKEKKLIEKNLLPPPALDLSIDVELYLSTIDGKIYEMKDQTFSLNEIISFIKRLNNKHGAFYQDREIWNAISRVERGKVSNRLRFAIYKRDGYRCRICGVSERYADLEVDHIIPIAKGGKTNYNNLQTLCHRCNVEKGDKLQ